jgi:hypothetical protein
MKNATKKKRRVKLGKRKVRRNQEEGGADFPVGEIVDVDQIRINKDGTLDVFIEDAEIPPAVTASENRRRANRKPAKRKK